jgi:hypothetical protein
MSTNRLSVYITGVGWKDTLPSIYYASAWHDVRAVWVYQGAWKLVVILKAPPAADNSVVAALVGGVFSHELNFSWTSFDDQVSASGVVHVYLDGSQITQFGFSAGTSHSENFTIPDLYGTTGGSATAKVAYLPSAGSTEGTLSPASNAVTVVPWL